MPLWDLHLPLDPSRPEPLYLQVVEGIAARIRSGALQPGAPLPGSRALSEQWGIHRNTVLAAFRELVAEGWIETKVGGGTTVSLSPPLAHDTRTPAQRPAARPQAVTPSKPFRVQTGLPDGRLIPTDAFARAYRWALRMVNRDGGPSDVLGPLRLRLALVEMLAYSRGLRADTESLMITPGGSTALSLVAQALLEPGDEVAVETPGYPAGWDVLRRHGATLSAVAVDEEGLNTEALDQLCRQKPIRAVFTTPQRQYPTTVPMGPGRREALMSLAKRHGFLILEYDHDTEFQFDGRPPLPLASQGEVPVVFVGSLSKLLAPGMRLGLIHAPRDLMRRLAGSREGLDLPGDPVLEWAVIDLLESGELLRHLNRTRRVYQARRDHLVSELEAAFPTGLSCKVPSGGMALWLKTPGGLDVDEWSSRAEREGVIFRSARSFDLTKRFAPAARLAFGAHDEGELSEVVRRLKQCYPAG